MEKTETYITNVDDNLPEIAQKMMEHFARSASMGAEPQLFVIREEDYKPLLEWLGIAETEAGGELTCYGVAIAVIGEGECYCVATIDQLMGDVPRSD